jgi:hypothetical protein
VELLVASAVLGLLLVLLAQVSGMVANTWTDGQGRAERRQNGRALVDFVGRELRAASLPVNSGTTPDVPNLQFVLNPSSVGQEFRNSSCLFWQAPIGTSTVQGDMAVIGYFVKWDSTGLYPRASLCRFFANPGEPGHRIYKSDSVNSWVSTELLTTETPATQATGYRGLFAENVVGFWARCLDAQGNAVTNSVNTGFDSRQGYSGKDASGETVSYVAPVLPTSVEVSIVLLSSRAASKMTSQLQTSLIQLTRNSTDADDCMTRLQADLTTYRPILQGATTHKLRVYLENGP